MTRVQQPKLIQNIFLGVGILLLIIAGYSYLMSREEKDTVSTTIPEEIIVQEEGVVKKNGEEIEVMSEEEVLKMREEVDGVLSTGGQTAVLKDVTGSQAKGEVKRAFSDGKFYYRITASGLRGGEKGCYFEGWLRKDDDYLSVGRMEINAFNEGVLYYTASIDRSNYDKALVTLEFEDGNSAPAKAVLEGTF